MLVDRSEITQALGILLAQLQFSISREAQYPSRDWFDQELKAIEVLAQRAMRLPDARKKILEKLPDPRILALLADGDVEIEDRLLRQNVNMRLVRDLAARARERIPRQAVAVPGRLGTLKRGRGFLYPAASTGPNRQEHCALICSILWRRFTGDWPGAENAAAHSLCEVLWRGAGGEPHGGPAARDGSLKAWQRHLRASRAYRPPNHDAGRLIERIFAGPPPRRRPPEPTQEQIREFYDHPIS